MIGLQCVLIRNLGTIVGFPPWRVLFHNFDGHAPASYCHFGAISGHLISRIAVQ